jgi:TonB family protein
MKRLLILSLILGVGVANIVSCSSSEKSSNEKDGASPVETALVTHRKEFRACYLKGIEGNSSKPSGVVIVYFIIESDGSVRMAAIKKSTLHIPKVESCVLDLIKTIAFSTPKNGETEKVTYPFKFTSK